jgi:hypothetical protein
MHSERMALVPHAFGDGDSVASDPEDGGPRVANPSPNPNLNPGVGVGVGMRRSQTHGAMDAQRSAEAALGLLRCVALRARE